MGGKKKEKEVSSISQGGRATLPNFSSSRERLLKPLISGRKVGEKRLQREAVDNSPTEEIGQGGREKKHKRGKKRGFLGGKKSFILNRRPEKRKLITVPKQKKRSFQKERGEDRMRFTTRLT